MPAPAGHWSHGRMLVVGAGALLLGAGAVTMFGLPGLSASLAVVAIGVVRWRRAAWAAALTAGVAVVSMVVTAVLPRPGGGRMSGLGPTAVATGVELLALLVLIVLVARQARPRRRAVAAGVLLGGGVATLVLRLVTPVSVAGLVSACGLWSLMAVAAAVTGGYLRGLDDQRARSVAAARRAQRLDLARDLHDYVAHDVSEMVAQAQAAVLVGTADPLHAQRALERIEQSGLRALAVMDRTVHMLRELDDRDGRPSIGGPPGAAALSTPPGLAALHEVADRFSTAGSIRVALDLEPGLDHTLPPEVAATAHRVVVEALTNVRRHAAAATQVKIGIRTVDQAGGGRAARVTVTDDGASSRDGPRAGGRRGGLGLPGLRERAEALGGTLTAGPHGTAGWQVIASLPLTVPAEGRRRA